MGGNTKGPYAKKTIDYDHLNEQVSSTRISADTKLEILCQAVGTCPQVSLQFGKYSLPSLLDSGSEVTLVRESYFEKYIKPIVTPPFGEKVNAHNLFQISGIEQG